ncbi:MAG TPA: phosphate ABC transporter substrate-binding protein [Thermoclostridium sp.]|nr:phosphate ABC transporter substrate-binding protein [Clostridiaceae bacterium]HOQ75080.1 phosphate ABC transporter substrate-binding protein [Thermoclostridium sp.]HPU44972.1 phosphate ABC transporter substrate-binding protein [Thermoclostridium sp.]
MRCYRKRIITALLLGTVFILAACRGDPAIKIAIEGSTSMQKMMQEMADAYMDSHTHITAEYTGSGSSSGIRAVISGTADIGAVSRVVSEEELSQGLQAIHIAWDAIAVIIHPSNSVQDLTSEQVARIYKKEITNWSEVGGPDAGIVVVTRDPASGTREAFDSLFGIRDKVQADQEAAKTGETLIAVAQNPNAVGYVSLSYVRKGVKAISIDGIEPSAENVLKGSYEIRRPLIIVTSVYPDDIVQDFIGFMLSEDGKVIIEREAIPIERSR